MRQSYLVLRRRRRNTYTVDLMLYKMSCTRTCIQHVLIRTTPNILINSRYLYTRTTPNNLIDSRYMYCAFFCMCIAVIMIELEQTGIPLTYLLGAILRREVLISSMRTISTANVCVRLCQDMPVVAIDMGWRPDISRLTKPTSVALIQLASKNSCLLIHICHFRCKRPAALLSFLRCVLYCGILVQPAVLLHVVSYNL